MIYVFKTTVKTKKAVMSLKSRLDTLLADARWTFDLTDCDHVLRIDSNTLITMQVIELLNQQNFDCIELE